MTLFTRFKYLVGMLLVVAVVAALAIYMNNQISTVRDVSATVKARSYTVGTGYPGVLVHEYVHPGDTVVQGERMFVVRSSELARDVARGGFTPPRSAYGVRNRDELVVRATQPGKVVSVPHTSGSYLDSNTVLARVQKRGSSYVRAEFRLTPTEYALIRHARTATVVLPDQQQLSARITDVSVHTRGQTAVTRVRARTPRLTNHGLFASGTPIQVQVRLHRHDLLDAAEQGLKGLLTPGGTG